MQSLDRDRTTTSRLRPRYASANTRTWVGFKQYMYLAEEAVLHWFRERGYGPGHLYDRYGVGLEIVDSSVLLSAVLKIDDQVDAQVGWRRPGHFGVRLTVTRDGKPVPVLRGRVAVALVTERDAPVQDPLPHCLAPLVVPTVSAVAEPVTPPPVEPFTFQWQARYFHCHYSNRVQHGTYVQALEEVVDRFLASNAISVPRMLVKRGWIPVVSRARVRLLADAHMDDQIMTTFTVTDIIKNSAFDGRMDSYIIGPGQPRPVATAQILHGYANTAGAGALTELDPATVAALTGETL